jgi:hypothetical protein
MARERWPNDRRSSGANQRALRNDSLFFMGLITFQHDAVTRLYLTLFQGWRSQVLPQAGF